MAPANLSHPPDIVDGMKRMTFTDELLFSIEANISRCGWHATAVFGGPEPPWVYTIGIIETWSHPELIVFGLDAGSAHWLLSAVVDDLKAGVAHETGRDTEFDLDGTRVCLLPVSDRYWRPNYDYLLWWPRYYRARGSDLQPEALQLVWSDEEGRFPWDDGFDTKLARLQPFLDRPGAAHARPTPAPRHRR